MESVSALLTAASDDKPPLATYSPASYVFLNPDGELSQHIIYQGFTSEQGSDGRVHELWSDTSGNWHHHDLFNEADGAASVAGQPFSITGYAAGEAVGGKRTQHVNYLGTDGGIHELWWDDDGWHHRSLTGDTGAPAGLTSPKGYVFGSDQHVVYAGVDLHVHDLHWHGGYWEHTDLTMSFGGPPVAAGSVPTAYLCDFQNTQHIDYRGAAGHIHELAGVEGSWAYTDLTLNATGPQVLAAGDPSGYVLDFQRTQHVRYRGVDGQPYELRWSVDRWENHDLATESQNDVPPGLPGGALTGYVFEPGERQYINYWGMDDHIYQIGWQSGAWETSDATTLSGAPQSISNPTGYIFPTNENAPHVAYTSKDDHDHDHRVILLTFSP